MRFPNWVMVLTLYLVPVGCASLHTNARLDLAPDARLRNVSEEDVSFVRHAVARYARGGDTGPITAVGGETTEGERSIRVYTLKNYYDFSKKGESPWRLQSYGPYNAD
jgi:hypothetical protein